MATSIVNIFGLVSNSPRGIRVTTPSNASYKTVLATSGQQADSLTAFNDSITTNFTDTSLDPVVPNIGFNITLPLKTLSGNDTFTVRRIGANPLPSVKGMIVDDFGSLDLGAGNDFIDLTLSPAGYTNSDALVIKGDGINLGSGVNTIKAVSNDITGTGTSSAILNYSTANTRNTKAGILGGTSADTVLGDGQLYGILNGQTSDPRSAIILGGGGDKISAYCTPTGKAAIENNGLIDLADRNSLGNLVIADVRGLASNKADSDVIFAVSTGHPAVGVAPDDYNPSRPAILNNGDIITGAGKDVVDALSGGFAGLGGNYYLGVYRHGADMFKDTFTGLKDDTGKDILATPYDNEVDVVNGFGHGNFWGGGGINSISLPEYQVAGANTADTTDDAWSKFKVSVDPTWKFATDGVTKLYSGTITSANGPKAGEATMSFHDFSLIGGANATYSLQDRAGRFLDGIDFSSGVPVPSYSTPATPPTIV